MDGNYKDPCSQMIKVLLIWTEFTHQRCFLIIIRIKDDSNHFLLHRHGNWEISHVTWTSLEPWVGHVRNTGYVVFGTFPWRDCRSIFVTGRSVYQDSVYLMHNKTIVFISVAFFFFSEAHSMQKPQNLTTTCNLFPIMQCSVVLWHHVDFFFPFNKYSET